ncbi:hypothetical protein [Acinetobacter sp. Ac_5812]|uniref:hypothetical protein n=1 Tax=Acinetobacter sp. Ac_5812 TaxID=1848937 RepID=UPI00148FF919|nr:hypothetical protein [Acinetobacter sp. Ac_5812]NNP70929.1 hypothetical protein [Acinetobacter sp. Ac_5812]
MFNVGDYIVLKASYDSRPMPVLLITEEDDSDYITPNGFVDKDDAHRWRIATAEEVAVGHRLD